MGGLDAAGSGSATEFTARTSFFLLGDQLRSRSGDPSCLRDGEEGLDVDGAHDFRARVRNVPATDRPKLLGCSSFSLLVLLVSRFCGASSSGDREKRALVNIFLFAFLETRRKSSMFAEWALSFTLTFVSEGKDMTCSEKVRLIVGGTKFSLLGAGR